MDAAIAQARKSLSEGGIPIGSALARNGALLAVGHNKRVQESDPVAHAEIDCLRNAGRRGSFRETVLYSTLVPCSLCAGAVGQDRLETSGGHMSGVRVLVGTRKGAFVLTSDGTRQKWDVAGPHFLAGLDGAVVTSALAIFEVRVISRAPSGRGEAGGESRPATFPGTESCCTRH